MLSEVGIDSFLAHDDLEVSDHWRERILELKRCDIFVPLLSERFLSSMWAPQEAGFIISRPNVTIAPLSIDGTMPFGFMSQWQARRIPEGGISRELLVEPLAHRIPRMILPGLIRIAGTAGDFRSAEAKMRPLVALFPNFAPEEAQALAEASVENGQIWSASLCRREYLPELVRTQGANIAPATLRALEFQIQNDSWYFGDGEDKTIEAVASSDPRQQERRATDRKGLVTDLSVDARGLLREAGRDRNGYVLMIEAMGGMSIETNERAFAERGDPRSEARWRGVVLSLVAQGLLEQQGVGGETFRVTDLGYQMIDRLAD